MAGLRTNRDYIIAGSASKSALYQRLIKDPADKERMPKSKGKPGDKSYRLPLSSEEIEEVKGWIEGASAAAGSPVASAPAAEAGEPAAFPRAVPSAAKEAPASSAKEAPVAAEKARPFATDAQVENALLKDLEVGTIPPADRRYLSLANCYNSKDAAGNPLFNAERMARAKVAVDKLLNSLSYQPAIHLSQVVDNRGILLRLRLSDYGWTAETWEQVANVYPFAVQTAELEEAQRTTGSKQVWMRADWFVFAVSQPPLYNKFLHLPGDTGTENAIVQLEAKLGLRYEEKVKEEGTVRSGFERSGVSQGNRIIERISLPSGAYYWKSYDFNKDRKNDLGGDIFQSPLGPVDAGISVNRERIFSQDGGEFIFSLPNGLQGYMLANARGNRLDQAPKDVVRDSSRKDGLIINGISCMSCHKDGLLVPSSKDEIAPHAKSLSFAPGELAEVERLYNQEKMLKALKEDQERFTRAVEQLGQTGSSDPVREMYDAFRQDIPVENISAELGRDIPTDEVAAKMDQSTDQRTHDAAAGVRQKQHALPRITVIQIFPELAVQLNLGRPRTADPHVYEEFGSRPVEQRTKAQDSSREGAPLVIDKTVKQKPIVVGDVINVDRDAGIKVRPPRSEGDNGKYPVLKIGQGQESITVIPRGSTKPIRVGPSGPSDVSTTQQNSGVAAYKTVETPPEPVPAVK